MSIFVAEIVGTALLLWLGDGVVANVLLKESKGENSGWIVITTGWGIAVFVGVFAVAAHSGAHINPAVTLGLLITGGIEAAQVLPYMGGQFIGAFIGAVLVYLQYLPHWAVTEDPGLKLAVFATGPAIRNTVGNLISEALGTFALVFGVLAIDGPFMDGGDFGALGALPVALLVFGIGLSLGGPTGYAINPARDLSPRIFHQIAPIPGKGDSDWGYGWIPIVGDFAGGALAALVYIALGRF
ncbi:MAG: aquaporin family protein [Chloroflexi bacterium]|nr:aquaporin family protein [Chloroflexota bacterium]